jgi:predicted Zn-dependent peptidase
VAQFGKRPTGNYFWERRYKRIYRGRNTLEVVELIKDEVHRFSNYEITDERLTKLKEQLKGNYILGLESTSSRMFSNGKSVLFLNRVNKPQDIINKIDAVSKDKLHSLLDSIFSTGIQNSAYVGQDVDLNKLISIIEGDAIAFKNQKSKRV